MDFRATIPLTLFAANHALAMSDTQLSNILQHRLTGDRTGACIAAAVLEGGRIARSFTCAHPKDATRIDASTAFEIGSISKTMTATLLLTQLIAEGKAPLDDPLLKHLPTGTQVPVVTLLQGGQQLRGTRH